MIEKFDKKKVDEALNEITRKYDSHEIDMQQMRDAVNRLYGDYGFLYNLNEYLTSAVNQITTFRAKEHLANVRDYASLRTKKEEEIIRTTNWTAFFDSCSWINEPMEDPSKYSDSTLICLELIIIQALKGYVDSRDENNPNCQTLYGHYKALKIELCKRGVVDDTNDSYQTYLKDRDAREEKTNLLERTRYTGEMCPYCYSTEVKADGNSWRCKKCGKYWRKRK